MKKSFICLLTASAMMFGMSSCGGGKKAQQEEAAKTESAAAIAGQATKSMLTEELKQETIQFLKDMPESDLPEKLASGEVSIGVADLKYMLPVAKAADLSTPSLKARALGMYLSDYMVLSSIGQPVKGLEGVIGKLVADLNITYLNDIFARELPANASPAERKAFYNKSEADVIEKLANDGKINLAVEILGGTTSEFACLLANPSLVVKGDATSAGISENMEKRATLLLEVVSDLSSYYPELSDLGTKISALQGKLATISSARANNSAILSTRDSLLK